MFTGCFFVLLCLLLGPLEARPLPKKQMKDLKKHLRIKYMGDSMERDYARLHAFRANLETIPAPKKRFRVFVNRNNRFRGDFMHRPYVPGGRMMKGSMFTPEETPEAKLQMEDANNLPDQRFSEENMIRSKPSTAKTIRQGLSKLAQWLLIGLGILAVCIVLGIHLLRDMCNKYGDKIPIDKIVDVYSKPK